MATNSACRHMSIGINPKTSDKLTTYEVRLLLSVQPHNRTHNHGVSFPGNKTAVLACSVQELKAMIIAPSGSETGRNGKAMKK